MISKEGYGASLPWCVFFGHPVLHLGPHSWVIRFKIIVSRHRFPCGWLSALHQPNPTTNKAGSHPRQSAQVRLLSGAAISQSPHGLVSHSRVDGMEITCPFQCVGTETCYVRVPNRGRLRSWNPNPSISRPGEGLAGMGGGRVSHHSPDNGSEASQGSRLQRGGSTLPERLGVQTRWRQKFLPERQVSSLCRLHAHCGPSCGISLPRPSPPPTSPRDKPEPESCEGDDDGRHLGGAGRRRSRGGAVCIWENFLPWLPGASAVWLMIGKPPLDIPLFASYLRSHSTTLRVKGRYGSLLCSQGRAWPRMGIPRKKGVPGSVTGVRALRAGQTSTHPPRTQNMSMCVTFYCSSG